MTDANRRTGVLKAGFRWLFKTPLRAFGTVVWGALLLFFPVNFAAEHLLSHQDYVQVQHVMLDLVLWWSIIFKIYILCFFGSMVLSTIRKRRAQRRKEKAAAKENFLHQVEEEVARKS